MSDSPQGSRKARGGACEWGLPDEVGRHLAAVLAEDGEAIASAWHEALYRRLSLRPARIFPSDGVLYHVPELVRHLVRALHPDNGHFPPEILRDVDDLVDIRRAQGYAVEEMLVETDLLADILFEHLYAALRRNCYVSPGAAAAATACLSGAVRRLNSQIVGRYRDRALEDAESGPQVVDTIQHQLRSPLATITQGLDVLRRATGDEEGREDVAHRMGHAVDQIVELVEALPALLRGGGGPSDLRRLGDVLSVVVQDVNLALPDHDVDLRFDGEAPDILVDGPNTALVLHNLITNAVKYADPDKPDRWIRIAFEEREDGAWLIRVGDNGLGVSLAEQERIFQRFVRSHEGRAEGRGLGLAIVRDAVDRMGGRIGLESREGVGSTFFFTVRDLSAGGSSDRSAPPAA